VHNRRIKVSGRDALTGWVGGRPRILIVGGGYVGLYAALGLAKRLGPEAEVTLVNPESFMVYPPVPSRGRVGQPRAAPRRGPPADGAPPGPRDHGRGDRARPRAAGGASQAFGRRVL
jgi:NADH:ubiquinone reductase (H+-translocating)